MAPRRQLVCGAILFLHLFFVAVVSCRDTFSALAAIRTNSGRSFEGGWSRAEKITDIILGEQAAASNPLRQAVSAYTHAAGIESGYGFFAPNVPNSYKLVFELQYPDGRVEHELPQVHSAAAGLRLTNLFDYIGRSHYSALREVMLKLLAFAVWREHPEATLVRTVFGIVHLPTAAEFAEGKAESYEFLYAYDFAFAPDRGKARAQ